MKLLRPFLLYKVLLQESSDVATINPKKDHINMIDLEFGSFSKTGQKLQGLLIELFLYNLYLENFNNNKRHKSKISQKFDNVIKWLKINFSEKSSLNIYHICQFFRLAASSKISLNQKMTGGFAKYLFLLYYLFLRSIILKIRNICYLIGQKAWIETNHQTKSYFLIKKMP